MKKYLIQLISFFLLLLPFCSQAAVLRTAFDENLLKSSGKAIASIYLDSPGENINALSAEIVLISGQARFSEIRDGDSIISAWIERPEIKDTKIVFAGIIPGGFSGMYSASSKEPQPGLVLKLGISSDAPGEVVLGIKNLQAYSGNGDAATISTDPEKLTIVFSKKTSDSEAGLSADSIAPVFTDSTVTQLNNETKGWFAVFNAEDRDSGIDYFEIQETYNNAPDELAWRKTASPYKLNDQHRRHTIFIKAVDRSGNEKIVKIAPASLSPFEQWAWIIGVVLVLALGILMLRRRRNI